MPRRSPAPGGRPGRGAGVDRAASRSGLGRDDARGSEVSAPGGGRAADGGLSRASPGRARDGTRVTPGSHPQGIPNAARARGATRIGIERAKVLST